MVAVQVTGDLTVKSITIDPEAGMIEADLTDNIDAAGQVTHPEGVVVHDGDDPYLVVAADKGTATFSDIANGIAAEYEFWLGDVVARGVARAKAEA